jgi:hypothetical protein
MIRIFHLELAGFSFFPIFTFFFLSHQQWMSATYECSRPVDEGSLPRETSASIQPENELFCPFHLSLNLSTNRDDVKPSGKRHECELQAPSLPDILSSFHGKDTPPSLARKATKDPPT